MTKITTIGTDLAKTTFQVRCADENGGITVTVHQIEMPYEMMVNRPPNADAFGKDDVVADAFVSQSGCFGRPWMSR